MSHPFQFLAVAPGGSHVFASAKNEVQVFDAALGARVGHWVDDLDLLATIKLQRESSEDPAVKRQKIPVPGPGAPRTYNYIRAMGVHGTHFVATTDSDKAVVVFAVDYAAANCLTLVKRQVMPKRPCVVRLVDDAVLIGDKFGDVYRVGLDSEVVEPKTLEPLLGHVLMLTDMVVASNRVITADRDEHVRVLRYPKAYVIERFLFGHTAFVSSLCLAGEWLVTSGGDDFVCLWKWQLETTPACTLPVKDWVLPYLGEFHHTPERFQTEEEKLGTVAKEMSVVKVVSVDAHTLVMLVEHTLALFVLKLGEDGQLSQGAVVDTGAVVVDIVAEAGKVYAAVEDELLVKVFGAKGESFELVASAAPQSSVDSEDPFPLYHTAALRKRQEWA